MILQEIVPYMNISLLQSTMLACYGNRCCNIKITMISHYTDFDIIPLELVPKCKL